ncbi:MAG: Flp family type IVb pilin [Allosphingosinicella sp.]
MRRFFAIFKNEQGVTAVEYGLILAMVFLAMIVGVSSFGQTTIEMWDYVSNSVRGA